MPVLNLFSAVLTFRKGKGWGEDILMAKLYNEGGNDSDTCIYFCWSWYLWKYSVVDTCGGDIGCLAGVLKFWWGGHFLYSTVQYNYNSEGLYNVALTHCETSHSVHIPGCAAWFIYIHYGIIPPFIHHFVTYAHKKVIDRQKRHFVRFWLLITVFCAFSKILIKIKFKS